MEHEPVQTSDQPKPARRLTRKARFFLRALLIVACGLVGWFVGSSQDGHSATSAGGVVGLLFGLLFPVLWLSSCST
jgi:hypothetical protein